MSFIAPSEAKIVQESVQFNQPVSEASASAIGALANALREIVLPVGSVIASMLDEATFQAQNTSPSPERWILADGRDVTGSVYQTLTGDTNIPDFRGLFIRGKNNGRSDGNENPDGEKPLGFFSSFAIQSHNHGVTDPGHGHGIGDPGHAHTVSDPGHNHAITDPGHIHTITDTGHNHGVTDPQHLHTITDPTHQHDIWTGLFSEGGGPGNIITADNAQAHSRTYSTRASTTGVAINPALTGISVNNASTGITVNSHVTSVTINTNTTGLTVNTNTTGVTVASGFTGVSTNNTGGNQTCPSNLTINWFIRIN